MATKEYKTVLVEKEDGNHLGHPEPSGEAERHESRSSTSTCTTR